MVIRLESLPYSDVPEPAFDCGYRFVVAVLEAASNERWVFIRYVLHAKGDRGVIEPPLPVAAAILGCRDRHYVFLFAVLPRPHVLPTVLGKTRHFGRRRRRQVKRVVQDQVQRGQRSDFASELFITLITQSARAAPGLIKLC